MKKILGKLKAYFTLKGKSMEMELKAAEFKQGKAFLHPVDDENHIFILKTRDVGIFIHPEEEIREEDITVIDCTKEMERNEKISLNLEEGHEETMRDSGTLYDLKEEPTITDSSISRNKKVVRFSLYNDEYEALMKYIDEHGYKRAEFFLACANAAKKNSMTSLYNKYLNDHKQRRKEERLLAKEMNQ